MALWTPSRITTHLWLDASDASTLYDATSGGSPVAANGSVARWEDKSGNTRHVTQGTSGNRPLRKTSVQNSLDGILFDGTNDDLTGTVNLNTRDCSVFCVFLRTNSGTRAEIILSSGDDTATGDGVDILPRWTDGNAYLQSGYITNRVVVASSIGTTATLLAVTGGLNQTAYKDGSTFGSAGSNQSATAVTRTTSYIGSGRGVSSLNRYFAGHICETIWVDSVVNTATRQQIEGYLAWKWGTVSGLPADHPYKSVAPRAYKYPSLRTTAPVASYYARRDYQANDQISTNHGVMTGGVTRTQDGTAYKPDGTSGYVLLSPLSPTQITVSAWIKVAAVTSAINRVIVSTSSNFATFFNAYSIFVDTTGKLGVVFQDGAATAASATAPSAITAEWTHIAFTYDGTTLRLYVNGSQVTSSAYAGGIPYSSPNNTTIGARRAGSAATWAQFFAGLIDDVVFYSTALSATDIGYLAAQRGALSSGLYPSLSTGVVAAYYPRLDSTVPASTGAVLDQFGDSTVESGTLTSGATRANDSGLAYSFDGTDDYVSFGINAFGSGLNGATAISFAAWIKYTALIGAANTYGNVIFTNRLSLDGAGIWLNIRSDVGQSGKLLVGGRSRSSDAFQEATSTQVIAAGSWTHIAGVLDYTAKTVTTYINGVATAASSLSFGSNTYTNSTGTIVDAMGTNLGSALYQGLIDDAIIFSIGLSSTQIGYLASQRGAIYALASAGGSLINGQSLIRPADSKPYQQLIGA